MTCLYFHVNIRNVSTAKQQLFQIECTRTAHQGQWQGTEIEHVTKKFCMINLDHVHFQHKTVIYFEPNIWQYLHNCAFL
jgi:hypothetical protein